MGPKRGRGRSGAGEANAPVRRSSRRNGNPGLTAMEDDPEALLRRSRPQRNAGTRGQRGRTKGREASRSARTPPEEQAPPSGATQSNEQPEQSEEHTRPEDSQAPDSQQIDNGSVPPPRSSPPAPSPAAPAAPAAPATIPAPTVPENEAPTAQNEATDDANDGQQESTGKQSTTEQTENSGKDGKRSSSPSNEDGQRSPKKKKIEEGNEQRRSEKGERNDEKISCQLLKQAIDQAALEDREAASSEYNNPVREGQMLEDGDVYRAIASVTEAINNGGQRLFSILDPNALQRLATGPLVQTIARPRQEALIPYTNGGHTSLFAVHREAEAFAGSRPFRLQHFDSANGPGHGHERHHYNIVERILAAEWTGHGTVADRNVVRAPGTRRAAAPQRLSWTCGLHTIFNAWAFALDLTPALNIKRYRDFIATGSEIVRLAVQGRMDSITIWAFFDCFGFIEPNQTPDDLSFDRTVAFRDVGTLAQYVARTRIEEDVPIVPEWPDDFPFELAVEALGGMDALPDLTGMTAGDFLCYVLDDQEAIDPREPGQTPASQPGIVPQPGELSQQPPDGSLQTRAGQTAREIDHDLALARALQQQLDEGADRERPGPRLQENNMQSSSDPSGEADPHDAHAPLVITRPAESGEGVNDREPPTNDRAEELPATTSLLNRLNPALIPGETEYHVRQRARAAERQAASAQDTAPQSTLNGATSEANQQTDAQTPRPGQSELNAQAPNEGSTVNEGADEMPVLTGGDQGYPESGLNDELFGPDIEYESDPFEWEEQR